MKYLRNTLYGMLWVFFFVVMSITGFQMQKYYMGITDLEKRVIALEIEEARQNGIYSEFLSAFRQGNKINSGEHE